MKYTIISTILISKPPLFMCKAKVSYHAVWGVSILPLIVATVYLFSHIIDRVDIFQMCIYDHYMVPKIILFPFEELYFPSK
jgi:hypothetical protein